MDETNIRSEMHRLAQERIAAGDTTSLDELVHAVLDKRANIEGDDAPFYRVHTFQDLKRIAKSVVGKYEATDSTPEELLLPGFKHLQKAYSMKRDGAVVIVPIDQCTDLELLAREALFGEMMHGLAAHRREIREYVAARSRSAA